MPKEIKAFAGFCEDKLDLNPWPWAMNDPEDLNPEPQECFGIFKDEATAKKRYEDVRPVTIIVGD